MEYIVRVTTSETCRYHIEARAPEEARELVLDGDYDPYETVDASVDDVEVED
mgnify:CR=1 FL=1